MQCSSFDEMGIVNVYDHETLHRPLFECTQSLSCKSRRSVASFTFAKIRSLLFDQPSYYKNKLTVYIGARWCSLLVQWEFWRVPRTLTIGFLKIKNEYKIFKIDMKHKCYSRFQKRGGTIRWSEQKIWYYSLL